MSDKRPIVRARDVMRAHFIQIDGLATVAEALEKLMAEQARVLIVAKRSDDDEYGIVLLSDIAKHVLARDRSPERVNVYEVASKPVVSVPAGMDIRYCARLLENFGLTVVPVMEDGRIVGVMSYDDMVLRGLAQP